jgi:glutathione S-transferase
MYHLYFSPGACSVAAHIVLEEIGKPYTTELMRVALASNAENITDSNYLKVNPKGRIPALHTSDGILTEAPAILVYLARKHPEAGLLPKDLEAEARCYEWMAWAATTAHAIAFGQIIRPQRFVSEPKDYPTVIAKGRQNLADAFGYIEAQLQGRDWAVPGGYTIADPYLLFYYRAAKSVGLPMEERFPAWAALSEKVMGRPAVRRVLEKEAAVTKAHD